MSYLSYKELIAQDPKKILHTFYDRKRDLYTCDDILVFDIETTSAWLDCDGNIHSQTDIKDEEELDGYKPITLTYLWGFGINDIYFYGRDQKSFLEVLEWLPEGYQYYIYIHNSGFELMSLMNILTYQESIIRIAYKPIIYWFKEYPYIIFRCSWQLTQMSLREWGSILGLPKSQDLDYEIIRTPETKLKEYELDYSLRDLQIMTVGLTEYKHKYKHVAYIPITQTGCIRRKIKNLLLRNRGWVWKCRNMFPRDTEEMDIFTNAYWGGIVQASRYYINQTLHNVEGWDIDSAYIYALCCKKFPLTPFRRDYYTKNDPEKLYIMRIQIDGIRSLSNLPYISISKCQTRVEAVAPNGRLMKADRITLVCTSVDFEIIKKLYKYDKLRVLQCWSSYMDYLPVELIKFMLELHRDKTILKNQENKKIQYSTIKKELNGIGGMMATAPVINPLQYSTRHLDQSIWKKKILTTYEVDSILKEEKPKAFLCLPHAAFMTAYTRECIIEAMLGEEEKVENIKNVAYVDTDGYKCLDKRNHEWYNQKIEANILKVAQDLDLPVSDFMPNDVNGIPHMLGKIEKEYTAEEFRMLGGKQYCIRLEGKLKMTCSGINPEAVVCLNDDIENFKTGFTFDKKFKEVQTRQIIYVNDPTMKKIVWQPGKEDEYIDKYNRFGCHITARSYRLTKGEELLDLMGEDRAWCKKI